VMILKLKIKRIIFKLSKKINNNSKYAWNKNITGNKYVPIFNWSHLVSNIIKSVLYQIIFY
jgi:hypothetical protein